MKTIIKRIYVFSLDMLIHLYNGLREVCTMAYPTRSVANYILFKADYLDISVCPMKLQKLMYFAHGWHLAICGKPLVREKVQAWQFGPVFPSLYQRYKMYGNQPIGVYSGMQEKPFSGDSEALGIITAVIKRYGKYTATQLSNATHQPNTPWHQTWKGRFGQVIPNDLIEQYFISLSKGQTA